MVVKTGCVINGKICMSKRKIMKTVITVETTHFVMKTLFIRTDL